MNELKQHARNFTLLDDSRLEIIETAINKTKSLNGELWDIGAHKGGLSLFMEACLLDIKQNKDIKAFDTFNGMPFYDINHDTHVFGSLSADYNETLNLLKEYSNIEVLIGVFPKDFYSLGHTELSIAHIDVDNYDSIKESLEFTYPMVEKGGYIIIDDYNCKSCPGAKKAVDNFLKNKPEILIQNKSHQDNPQAYFIKI
jgi:O-methyltransferase